MSILKLTPSCKDYLWGGSRLRTDFGVQSDLNPLAEAWVLSCHPDGPSYLPDGTMLADYLAAHPEAAGTDCKKFEMFPVLTKFIDAKNSISIQVHPSNEYALEHEHQYGKTEMWYVLDCEPGAFLYYGFDHEISREELEERIRNNTLTEVLNAVPVKKAAELQRDLPCVRLRPRGGGRQTARVACKAGAGGNAPYPAGTA